MRVIISGGRNYRFMPTDRAYLDGLGITEVVTGAAPGADWEGILWARSRELPFHGIPAQWSVNPTAAGPIRNSELIAYLRSMRHPGSEVAVILFPGGTGTADMREKAMQAGFRILEPYGKQADFGME